ncbi:undecaprenyl diphosphate synthase [Lewinella aquimaris]|uniref:Isoprenyl transferase n=1 Tax=Neolewinella aquimaris TaxID=1835722 RepID=A0A840EDW8_9BACT|nr:isoprenyl transferase [Neolewinella aquimaris]MBB4080158.1 undecaprenyl diphosphate synthase [Neolewinella aquimaris]
MQELEQQIDKERLPHHVGVIMDGNGRWAQGQGKPRVFGHHSAVESVRATVEACAELGVGYLTLYAFSTENWDRPQMEVGALMQLLVDTIGSEMKMMLDNGIRLATIGDTDGLPEATREALAFGIEQTSHGEGMTLILALNYSGKWDIARATRQLAQEVAAGRLNPDSLDEAALSARLSTHDYPDPELIIRTSGEHRLSNFFLWQAAYAEFYFSPVFWPDFRKPDLYAAVIDFQHRERRFGKTSEQLKQTTNP